MQVLLESAPVKQASWKKETRPAKESESSFEQMLSDTPGGVSAEKNEENYNSAKKAGNKSDLNHDKSAPNKRPESAAKQSKENQSDNVASKIMFLDTPAINGSSPLMDPADQLTLLSEIDPKTLPLAYPLVKEGEIESSIVDYSTPLDDATSIIDGNELLSASLNLSATSDLKNIPTMKAEANLEQKISKLPILALLSGKASEIPQSELLALIIENRFLNHALSSSDLKSFLETPKPINTWIQDLGLSPDLVEQIPELKNMPQNSVDAFTLLEALSINPENAQAEIHNLSNKIAYEGIDAFVKTYGKEEKPLTQNSTNTSDDLKATLVKSDPFESIKKSWKTKDSRFIDFEVKPEEANPSPEPSLIPIEVSKEPGMDEGRSDTFKEELDLLSKEENLEISLEPASGEHSMNSDKEDRSSEKFTDSKDHIDFSNFELGMQRGSAKEFKSMVSSTEQNQEISRVQTELVQKAEMLVKEGGGSIKLDFNIESLGKLDVALSIEDKQLKLRITASNDHIREALAAELPRLKEALQAQQLDLKNIEVGIKQESNWQQDDRNSQSQKWQEESLSGGDGWQRQTKQMKFQEQSWTPARPNYNGRINVRV